MFRSSQDVNYFRVRICLSLHYQSNIFGSAGEGLAGGRASQLLGPLLLHTQRPRMLICGPEGSGQAHLGPAVLYALEGLPVHAIGLPSLLSDASARY